MLGSIRLVIRLLFLLVGWFVCSFVSFSLYLGSVDVPTEAAASRAGDPKSEK